MKIFQTAKGLSRWLVRFFRTFRLFCLWPCYTSADPTSDAEPILLRLATLFILSGQIYLARECVFCPEKGQCGLPVLSRLSVCHVPPPPNSASSSPHLCLHFRVTFFSRSARLCNVRRRPLFPPSYHVSLSLFPSTPFDCSGVCTPNFRSGDSHGGFRQTPSENVA